MRSRFLRLKTDTLELFSYYPALLACNLQYFRYGRPDSAVEDAEDVVVSLTSFPDRLGKLHNCIKSLMGQRARPGCIVLYLTREECSDLELPTSLTSLQSSLFEIRMVDENIRSLNKIFHALQDFPDRTIVTCDDDKLYPSDWLEKLIASAKLHPDCIVCNRSRQILFSDHGQPALYRKWPLVDNTRPAMSVIPLGVGGVLYPPGCLDPCVSNLELFRRLCPTSDDLWLKVMALLRGTSAVQAGMAAGIYPSIPFWNGRKLSAANIWQEGNDQGLRELMQRFRLTAESFDAKPWLQIHRKRSN